MFLSVALLPAASRAADAPQFDWNVWEHMPVLGPGRVEPLDTFARQTVEAICGREEPTLGPSDAPQAARLFPDGRAPLRRGGVDV